MILKYLYGRLVRVTRINLESCWAEVRLGDGSYSIVNLLDLSERPDPILLYHQAD